jgi:hypothetical protein
VTLPGATSPGNTLVCVLAHRQDVVSAGPTSSHGTWLPAVSINHPGSTVVTEIWYVSNLTGVSTVITVPAPGDNIAFVAEYSGVANSTVVDRIATNNGASAGPATTGATATTQKGTELWVAALALEAGAASFNTPQAGFTIRQQGADGGVGAGVTGALLDLFSGAPGTAATGANFTGGSDNWIGAIATFYGVETEVIAASVAAISTVTATLKRTRNLAAAVVAVSTVTATLTEARLLQSTVTVASSVTGTINRTRKLDGTVEAQSSVQDAPLHRNRKLVGAVSAVSAVSGSMDAVSSELVILSVAPSEVEGIPGTEMTLFGTFTLGIPIHIAIGPLGNDNDPHCYSGVPGQGDVYFSKRVDQLRVFLPDLPPGVYHLHAHNGDDSFTLLNAITVRPKQFRSNLIGLRRILPPKWDVGPRSIEVEP